MNKKAQFIRLGLVDYKKAWDYQVDTFNKILSVKSENRTLPDQSQKATDNYVIFSITTLTGGATLPITALARL